MTEAYTPIAKMVREMIARGVDPDIIELAVATAEQTIARQFIAEIPVDVSAEKRRAYDRERKRQSAEKRRNSTGPPQNSKVASLSSENISELKEEKRGANRGFRIPEEWQPTAADWTFSEQLIGSLQAKIELDKFVDHWKQQAGSQAVKHDWSAAWRNWVRRTHEYLENRNVNRTGNIAPTGHRAILAAASRKASELGGTVTERDGRGPPLSTKRLGVEC